MLRKLYEKYNSLSIQLRATVWFFICSVLQRGVSVITTPIFTRLLSTAEYGQYSVFNSWLSIVSIIVTLQLAGGVYTMGIVKYKEEEAVFTSSLQGLNLTLCLVWTIVYALFHNFWNTLFSLTTVQMLAMLVMIWTSSSFVFWMTTQRNAYRYRALVAVTLAVSLAKPLVGIFFVLHAQDKVTARILGLMLVEVIAYSGFFVRQMQKGKKFYSKRFWKYAILFNLPLIPHYLSGSILGSSDRIMIQRMVGVAQAGIYSLAYSISQIMTMVNDSLNKTMSPWLYQKIREKDYGSMSRVVYPSLLLIACANLLLIAVAPEVVAVFAPEEYYEAIYVIPPVAMSVYANYLYLCFAPFEFYFEKRIWTTIGTLTSAIANIFLNLIFIRLCGYYAAGYTTLVCYLINSAMHYYFMRRVCRTYLNDIRPYSLRLLVLISGVFMAVGFAYIPTYQNRAARYLLTMLILVVLFMQRKRLVPMVKGMLRKTDKKGEVI
ncbi:MAG: oligosaccharide flippase family protein [Lachnospiraceae bacterium]|nr:oligosaccharide flippase family protein [Lachnospiraceae bacterium]